MSSLPQDGALIATGSADRNVKIWGLDFGDCHKSLFAHDDRWAQSQTPPFESPAFPLSICVRYSVSRSDI